MKQVELKVLKLLLNRGFYLQYGESLSTKVFPSEIKGLMKTIAFLHRNKIDNADLSTDEVYHMYESQETTTVARLQLVKEILSQVDAAISMSPDVTLEVVKKIHEKEAARMIADKALSIVQRDDGAMGLEDLKEFVASINSDKQESDIEICTTNVEQIKERKKLKGVFTFTNGLEQLQEYVPSLSRGHFLIIFASTNAGKSSFVAQMSIGFLQQGHRVLYFGNEEPAEDIILNLVRSVESKTEDEVLSSPTPLWDKVRNNFTMIAAHALSIDQMEGAIKRFKPDVVVYDQLDNVQISGKQDRRHETLENLYQKTRQWGAKYGTLNIVLSQANDEATGKLKLRNNMMANSRIGKGGTGDLIIGIGMTSVDSPQRSICLCKNKISGKHVMIHMVLNHEICRFEQ